jgi:hypothetical protein
VPEERVKAAALLLALTGAAHADATVPATPTLGADYVLDDELRTRTPPAPRVLVLDFTGVEIQSRVQPPTRFLPLLRKPEPEVREIDPLSFVDDVLRAGEPAGGRTVVKRPKPEPRKRNLNVGAGR